jgi:hypothetical protein
MHGVPGFDIDKRCVRRDNHLAQTPGEGLLMLMRMKQDARAKYRTVRPHHTPSIGVVLPSGIGMPQGRINTPRTALLREYGLDNFDFSGLYRESSQDKQAYADATPLHLLAPLSCGHTMVCYFGNRALDAGSNKGILYISFARLQTLPEAPWHEGKLAVEGSRHGAKLVQAGRSSSLAAWPLLAVAGPQALVRKIFP